MKPFLSFPFLPSPFALRGSERVPGLRDFLSQNCRALCLNCGRSVLLVLALLTYQECAMDVKLLLPLRLLGLSLFSLLLIYRTAVLMVSLPPHREAPQHSCLQKLFVGDPNDLAKHLAEGAAALIATGLTSLYYIISSMYYTIYIYIIYISDIMKYVKEI